MTTHVNVQRQTNERGETVTVSGDEELKQGLWRLVETTTEAGWINEVWENVESGERTIESTVA